MNTRSRTSHGKLLLSLTALAAIVLAVGMIVQSIAIVESDAVPLYGSVGGTVTDATTGEPVEGALVTLYYDGITRTDLTDAQGRYSIDKVLICWCLKNLSASKDGFMDWYMYVSVGVGTVVDIALEPDEGANPSLYGVLTGTVTDADTGKALQDVLMTLSYHNAVRSTCTDADGEYTFTDVPICFCLKYISAHKDGYVDQSMDVAVGETTVVDIEMEPVEQGPEPEPEEGTLTGTVTDATTGMPIEGVAVTIEYHGATGTAQTDAEGRYALEGIPICRCLKNVTVQMSGYKTQSAMVGVGQGSVKDFALEPIDDGGADKGIITGTVTDATTGAPIAGAKVTLKYHDSVRTTMTEAQGMYSFSGVPECFCLKEVKVSVDGYHGRSKDVGVYGTTVVDFTLQPKDVGGDGSGNGIIDGEGAAGMTDLQLAVTGLMGGVLVLVVLVVYMSMLMWNKKGDN